MDHNPFPQFGHGDQSYQAAGQIDGVRRLVDEFYHIMETAEEFHHIRNMHPENIEVSRDKLTLFLTAWLGGPRMYGEKYGPIRIPIAHRHLDISETERDNWLACMYRALQNLNYPKDFTAYLIQQLAVPAERCRLVSEARQEHEKNA